MKNKFLRMSKAERRDAVKEYRASDPQRAAIYTRLIRLKVIGIFGIGYAIFSFCLDFFMDTINIWDYVLDGLLLIFCIIFVFKAKDLQVEQVNKYLINKGKKEK